MAERDVQNDSSRGEPADVPAEALAMRAQQGCRESFDVLARQFRPRLVQYLERRIGGRDGAEDLAQDTLARAWQHISRYDGRWRFSTWLYAIATRAAVDHHRQRRRSFAAMPGLRALAKPHPIAGADQDERLDDLWNASSQLLTGPQQSVLWLRYVEEMSIREIARALGKSAVAVRVTLFRARAILAEHLAGKSPEVDPRPGIELSASRDRTDNDGRRQVAAGVAP